MEDVIKQKDIKAIPELKKKQIVKYRRGFVNFFLTHSTKARQYAYNEMDKIEDDRPSFKKRMGWMSIAVLDSGTTPICLGLHNTFYSSAIYSDRFAIPHYPPRHYNCRSHIVTVADKTDRQILSRFNVDTVFKKDKQMAIDIMGKKKYDLWMKGDVNLKSYIDVKSNRFHTNKFIEDTFFKKK